MPKQNTVFISYRRTNAPLALNVYQHLTAMGYDVFYDIDSIRSGDWKEIILENIRARAHFLIVLTPSAAERFSEVGDIMRLEIETAMESKRNIMPLFMEGFDFRDVQKHLTGKLAILPQYNGLDMPMRYFKFAMQDLIDKHLEQDLDTVIHPVSQQADTYADEQQAHASAQPQVTQETLSAQEYFERGWQKHQAGDVQGAIADYTKAIELKPDYSAAYNNRGILKDDLQDYQGALSDYDRAIQIDPQYADAYNNRGNLKDDLQDYQGALSDYDRAIQIDPQYTDAYNNRGLLKMNHLQDYEGALADYDRAIQIDPQDAKAYYNRAVLKGWKLNDMRGAVTDFERALQANPNHAGAREWLPKAKEQLGEA